MVRVQLTTIFLTLFLLLTPDLAGAVDIRAFHTVNQLPVKQIFGLPSLDNSPLRERGAWRLNFTASISNTYSNSVNASEQLAIDSETLRTSLLFNYGLRDNLQLSVEVPYINHNRGFLDDFIYDWHDFFNMPQNGRTPETSEQFYISYVAGGTTLYELSDITGSLGDVRINGTITKPWKKRTLVFSAELKLPTGDYGRLTGSGAYDFSIGLMLNDPTSLGKFGITLYGGLAGMFLGDLDGALSTIQNNFGVAGRAGIGWQAAKHIQLKLQLDAQTPLYDSDLKDIGDPAWQLTAGGSLIFNDDVYLDISIAEDIYTLTAADVAFQLALVVVF